jgi:hypothetical protein
MFVTNINEDQPIRNKAKFLGILRSDKEWKTKRVSPFMSVLHIITDCISTGFEQLELPFYYVNRILIINIKVVQ